MPSLLESWALAGARGTVGTKWKFRIKPAGEARRPLVPDVAFIYFERLPYDDEAADIPTVAPDVVVEVRSQGDRQADIDDKVRVYLACGTSVIFLVDTDAQSVTIRDAASERQVSRHDMLTHASMPDFSLLASELFDRIKPKA